VELRMFAGRLDGGWWKIIMWFVLLAYIGDMVETSCRPAAFEQTLVIARRLPTHAIGCVLF
jgi:hypothetical protein